MMNNNASAVLWRRLTYMLSPQQDIYENIGQFGSGARILEIGFGTGLGILQYAPQAEYVDAVEIDPAAVSFARRTLPLRNVRWIHDDITNPSRNYRGYDLVVMIEVLEHIKDREKAITNLKRAMRPGGRGIVTVPNKLRHRRRREELNTMEWTPRDFWRDLNVIFNTVHPLTADLMPREIPVGDYRESPIVMGIFRGR